MVKLLRRGCSLQSDGTKCPLRPHGHCIFLLLAIDSSAASLKRKAIGCCVALWLLPNNTQKSAAEQSSRSVRSAVEIALVLTEYTSFFDQRIGLFLVNNVLSDHNVFDRAKKLIMHLS